MSMVAQTLNEMKAVHLRLFRERNNFVTVRAEFEQLANLSQRLTPYMRKEFAARTGAKWNAGEFGGWGDVSELFKMLRNCIEHDVPLQMTPHYTTHFDVPKMMGIEKRFKKKPDANLQLNFSLPSANPLQEYPQQHVSVKRTKLPPGLPAAKPSRTDCMYELIACGRDEEKMGELLKRIGTSDIHVLADSLMRLMKEYSSFFFRRLSEFERSANLN